MLRYLSQPWPWYIAGPAITAVMLALLYSGKTFGFSSNLRTICSIAGAGKKVPFFQFDHKKQYWNLLFLLGAIIGGFISQRWLTAPGPLQLSAGAIQDLQALRISFDGQLLPEQLFGTQAFLSVRGWSMLAAGGFLVGFGSRYAGGCTSGHAITGLSTLQWPSLIAVTGFFIGGLIMTHLLFPLFF